MARQRKIGPCGARAPPPAVDRRLTSGKPFGFLAVDVLCCGITGPPRRLHQRLVKELPGVDRHNLQRTTRSMVEALTTPAGLGALEIRQDIRISPTLTTQL